MRRLLLYLLFAAHVVHLNNATAQTKKSVIIGSYVDRPNAVLALNPADKNQGFLLPQLTTAERNTINTASPADDGLVVYDVSEKSFFYWKENKWVKGLGTEILNETISFDPSTKKLSLGTGSSADLSSLIEIPPSAGQNGKYLTTDGTTLSWKDIPIIDNQVIAFNSVTKQLTISKSASTVDLSSLSDLDKTTKNGLLVGNGSTITGLNGTAVGQVLKWNGTNWLLDLSITSSDGLTLEGDGSLLSPIRVRANGITSAHLADNSVAASDIQTNAVGKDELADAAVDANAIIDGAVTGPKLATSSVATTKIVSGGNNKVLTTNSTGVVTWSDRSAFTDNQSLSLTGNTLSIDRGVSVNLANLSVGGSQISGSLSNLSITDGSVTSADIADNSISTTDILDNTVDAADLKANAVTTTKIASGGNNKVLTTDATGAVAWSDKSVFTDNQSLSLAGNTLSIDRGVAANLSNLTVGGSQISGSLSNLSIVDGSVSSADITDNSISSTDIADNTIDAADLKAGAVTSAKIASGGNDKVLTTDESGIVTWTNKSAFYSPMIGTISSVSVASNQLNIVENATTRSANLNTLTLQGDVAGALNATTVAKLQNNPISATSLSAADAGKMLVWDGSEWRASSSTSIIEYVSMDPAQFVTMKPDDSSDKHNTVIFQSDNTFLTALKDGAAEDNFGWIQLPHGATILEATLYYMDKDGTNNINFIFSRKSLTGTIEQLFTMTTTGSVDAISTTTVTSFNGREVVDNSQYTYRLRVTFNITSGEWDTPDEALQRFYGLRIKYAR